MTEPLYIGSGSAAPERRRPPTFSGNRLAVGIGILAVIVLIIVLLWPHGKPAAPVVVQHPAPVVVSHAFTIEGRNDSIYRHLAYIPDETQRVKRAIQIGHFYGEPIWLSVNGRRHPLTYAKAWDMADGLNRRLIEVSVWNGERLNPDIVPYWEPPLQRHQRLHHRYRTA